MHIYINILFTLYYLIYIQLDIKIKEEVFLYYQEVKYSNEEIITYISYIIDLYDIIKHMRNIHYSVSSL